MTQHQRLLEPAPDDRPAARPTEQAKVAPAGGVLPAQETNSWLDLLLPDKLPAETAVGEAERQRLHVVLCGLLQALELDHSSRLKKLDELLADLAKPDSKPAEISTAGLPLTPFQANDYDRYFRVNRLSTTEPAMAMVRSLLQTVHAVTHLFDRSGDLPEIHVHRQIEGFVSHTHLLARAFGLEPLR